MSWILSAATTSPTAAERTTSVNTAKVLQKRAPLQKFPSNLPPRQDCHSNWPIYRWLERAFNGELEKVRAFLRGKKLDLFSLVYRTHDSRYSQAGFPDLMLIQPTKPKIISPS